VIPPNDSTVIATQGTNVFLGFKAIADQGIGGGTALTRIGAID
jgi:hypothetical protein